MVALLYYLDIIQHHFLFVKRFHKIFLVFFDFFLQIRLTNILTYDKIDLFNTIKCGDDVKFSPVGVFKVVVIVLFIVIVALCAFRNYPQSETLTIVRSAQTTSVSQTTPESEPPQTTQSKAVTSIYSEPKEIIPPVTQTESVNSQEQTDIFTDELRSSAPQTESLIVEQTPYSSDIVTSSQTTENSRIININTATAAQLKTLTGIGDVKAQAIIDYRELHGDFASIDDLTKVNGIGEKTLEKIRDDITV